MFYVSSLIISPNRSRYLDDCRRLRNFYSELSLLAKVQGEKLCVLVCCRWLWGISRMLGAVDAISSPSKHRQPNGASSRIITSSFVCTMWGVLSSSWILGVRPEKAAMKIRNRADFKNARLQAAALTPSQDAVSLASIEDPTMGTKDAHLAQALKLRALAAECRRLAKVAADENAERLLREPTFEYEALADEEERSHE